MGSPRVGKKVVAIRKRKTRVEAQPKFSVYRWLAKRKRLGLKRRG